MLAGTFRGIVQEGGEAVSEKEVNIVLLLRGWAVVSRGRGCMQLPASAHPPSVVLNVVCSGQRIK